MGWGNRWRGGRRRLKKHKTCPPHQCNKHIKQTKEEHNQNTRRQVNKSKLTNHKKQSQIRNMIGLFVFWAVLFCSQLRSQAASVEFHSPNDAGLLSSACRKPLSEHRQPSEAFAQSLGWCFNKNLVETSVSHQKRSVEMTRPLFPLETLDTMGAGIYFLGLPPWVPYEVSDFFGTHCFGRFSHERRLVQIFACEVLKETCGSCWVLTADPG